MNWIERLYEIKNKDLYSQNGEGLILEYIEHHIGTRCPALMFDIGCGDEFILSNSRHLIRNRDFKVSYFDKLNGLEVTLENCTNPPGPFPSIISIDIDGNDYWILDKILPHYRPQIVCAEFNPAFLDSRTIAYNPDHVWDGTHYYGFSFEAGKKLAEKHGYKVIFQLADMNMFMVRADLIEGLKFPEVTFKQNFFFEKSPREQWVMV